MKKGLLFLIIVFIASCNSNKETKPIVCVESIEYHEPVNNDLGQQPTVAINIKVEDSSVIKKLEGGKLMKPLIFSIKKEDNLYFYYKTYKPPFRKGNVFSFILWTSYFEPNIFNNRKVWKPDEIREALNGDIGLVFDKDTIRVGSCKERKSVIQTVND